MHKRVVSRFPGGGPHCHRDSAGYVYLNKPIRCFSSICTANRVGTIDMRPNIMKIIVKYLWKIQLWKDTNGQDLIEYALMAGFVAIAAGAIMPGVSTSISKIFSKVSSTMTAAAAQS